MRKGLEAAILLLLGIYLLETRLTGEIAYYIAVQFYWLPVVAGVILILLGGVRVALLFRDAPPLPPQSTTRDLIAAPTAHGKANEGKSVSWGVLALIAVPLALGTLVPAKPLTSAAIGGSGITLSISAAPAGTYTIAPESRTILDWVRAFTAAQTPEEFNGQTAEVIGFVYRDIRFTREDQFMVARFVMQCCTADAQAFGVIVESPATPDFPQDSWVRVRGKFAVRTFDDTPTPVLIAESVEATPMPDRPYLYP